MPNNPPPLGPPLISLTPEAAEYIKKRLKETGIKYTGGMRFSIKAGKCQGLHYHFEIVDQKEDSDFIVVSRGARLIMAGDEKSMAALKGTTIGLSDNLIGSPFIFNNPNAQSACGCGESFSLKEN